MAHLGGTPPQDQLSGGTTLNTNADVVDTLQLPSQPSNRWGSREMIAGRIPVIVESAGTHEEGDVGLEGEVSSFVDFVMCVSNFSGQFLLHNIFYSGQNFQKQMCTMWKMQCAVLLLLYLFAVARSLFTDFTLPGAGCQY